jgi:uncharacterized protein YndB with AHSA1/START domain
MSDNVAVHPTALVVRKEITVGVDPQRAFDVFTKDIGTWWVREHHNGPGELETVVMEPREGGRCYNREVGGDEYPWGKVLTWEPPDRVVFAWQLTAEWAYDPDFVTEVEVTFTPSGSGSTLVVLEHRNLDRYGEMAEQMHAALDSDGGWGGSLASFGRVVEEG